MKGIARIKKVTIMLTSLGFKKPQQLPQDTFINFILPPLLLFEQI